MAVSSLRVTKLAAAQRQLRAAIRMFFAQEDELATHTVASAAYKIIADLKGARGRDEVADYYLTAIFYTVRDYRRGTLPKHFTSDPEAMVWVREMADQLPIGADSKPEDVKVSVGSDMARTWWLKRNKVANFLKHADRDPKAHVALAELDNLHLLLQGLASYSDLVKDDLGAEGLMLWIYFTVTNGAADDLPAHCQEIAQPLVTLSPDDRLRFCWTVLQELR